MNIVVTDCETTGLDCSKNEIVQIAAVVIDADLNIIEDTFLSLMRPTNWDTVEKKALEINKLTVAELETAPLQKEVWKSYCDFVNKYKTGNTQWNAPVVAGHN